MCRNSIPRSSSLWLRSWRAMHIFRLLQCLCQQLPVGSRCRPGAVDSQQISQCVTRVSSPPPRNLRRNSCVFIIIVIISTNNRQRFWVTKNISKKIQHTVTYLLFEFKMLDSLTSHIHTSQPVTIAPHSEDLHLGCAHLSQRLKLENWGLHRMVTHLKCPWLLFFTAKRLI